MIEDAFSRLRSDMVRSQIEARGIQQVRVLNALRSVPRHLFIPEAYRSAAYEDRPLPIACGQTISQPYMVALMTELLELQGTETVLEVGTGSGYQAAVLAQLCAVVHTIEYQIMLAEQAGKVFQALGLGCITVHTGDGTLGFPAAAPYHGIVVTAAAPQAPQPLLQQLAEGGRLVLPVGGRAMQQLEVWTRRGQAFERSRVLPVSFVPLRGEFGWDENHWPAEDC